MATLVLGPLLRHVGTSTATVWVETDAPCTAEVLGHRARPWQDAVADALAWYRTRGRLA